MGKIIRIDAIDAVRALYGVSSYNMADGNGNVEWKDGHETTVEETTAINAKVIELQADQPLKLLRAERDGKLKEEVDPKTCEAYNNGTQLSTEWKNYRQALLDMTLQTPTLDENGNLKAGLELDEIYWPTKPE